MSLYKRILFIVLGSALVGVGIALTLKTNLGSDCLSLLYSGIMQTFSITFGQACLFASILFLIPVVIFGRKHIGLGTIISPVIVSFVCDELGKISIISSGIVWNVILLLIGLCIIGIGIAIYSFANLGKSSYDACIFMLVDILKKPLSAIRIVNDFSLCVIGVFLGGSLAFGHILSIFLLGCVIQKTYLSLQK